MKRLIALLVLLSFPVYAEDWVDGKKFDEFEIAQWDAISAPSVSPSNAGRIYYNGTSDTLKASVNGGAYSDIFTALTGLAIDGSNADQNIDIGTWAFSADTLYATGTGTSEFNEAVYINDDLRLYDSTGADYLLIHHDGTDAIISPNAGNILLYSPTNVQAMLGDAAGSNEFQVLDNATAKVASIDSDGNGYIKNSLLIGTVGASPSLTIEPWTLDSNYLVMSFTDGTGTDTFLIDHALIVHQKAAQEVAISAWASDGLAWSDFFTDPTTNHLIIRNSEGDISFEDDNLTTTGNINATSFLSADITLGGTTGVKLSGAAETLTLAGLGGTYNENLTLDFDGAAANTVYLGTGTGVTTLNTNAIGLTTTGTVSAEQVTSTDDMQASGKILLALDGSASDNFLGIGAGQDLKAWYDGSGGVFSNVDVSTANTTGKLQFYGNFTSSGNYASSKGNLFSSTIDLTGGTNVTGTYTYISNSFVAGFEYPNMPMTGQISTFNYTGTNFTNTLDGNSVAGFNSGTGNLTGVGLTAAFTGTYVTNIGGFNFYPILFDIDFTASCSATHQISGLDSYVTYNAANTTNQLYGFRLFPEAKGSCTVGGAFTGFYVDMLVGTATLNDPVAYYRAYFNNSYDTAFDTAIASTADAVIGFWAEDAGGGWAMANQNTYGFYSTLVNNAKNFSFVSTGADGWMNTDVGGWMFGADKDIIVWSDANDTLKISGNAKDQTADPILLFDSGNDGSIQWMEDEDYFSFNDDIFIPSTEYLYFRDSTVNISSQSTTRMDLNATYFDWNPPTDTDIVFTFVGTTNSGIWTWMEDEDYFKTDAVIRGATSLYRRYYHMPVDAFNPGASGATFTPPSSSTIGGYQINGATEFLYFETDVHSDWDGASDLKVEIVFDVNIDNTGGAVGDTVDLKLQGFAKGNAETSCKTLSIAEVATTVGQSAQYKQFKATFTIDYDAVGAVVEAGDRIGFILNIETDTSEVDDIIVSDGSYYYNTTHIGIESGDV